MACQESSKMKARHVGLLFLSTNFIFPDLSWGFAQKRFSQKMPPVSVLSAGDGQTCVIDNAGVQCWGSGYGNGEEQIPALHNPRQISSGGGVSCALDDDGIKCWGRHLPPEIPEFKNPKQVSVGKEGQVCVIDGEELRCLVGPVDFYKIPAHVSLKHPRQVSVGKMHVCALDDDGVQCWGNDPVLTRVPTLESPSQISAGPNQTCVIDEDQVKCWGYPTITPYSENGIYIPRVKNPKQVSVGFGEFCILDDEGVKCAGMPVDSGTYVAEPTLKNPKQISLGGGQTCALDDDGVKCWEYDSNGETKVPPGLDFNLFRKIKQKASSLLRYRYCLVLDEVENELERNSPADDAQYLFYSLLGPTVASAHSAYFENILVPEYNEFVSRKKANGKWTDISALNGSVRNRQIALRHIQATLSVSLDLFSVPNKEELQPILRILGMAVMDPSDTNIKSVLEILRQKQSLLDTLRQSEKSVFLADTMNLAAQWLGKKIQ
jgi:hypothetical protein